MKENHLLELVVVSGQQAGARSIVKPEGDIEISDSIDSDIVLSDPLVKGKKVELSINRGDADLHVLSGEVSIAGQHFSEGQVVKVLPYQTMTLGDTSFAYGDVDAPDWEKFFNFDEDWIQCPGQINSVGTEITINNDVTVWSKPWVKYGFFSGAAFVFCLLTAFIYISFSSAPTISLDEKVASVKAIVNDAGFSELDVSVDNAGKLVISGYIATAEKYAELERLLDRKQIFSFINLQVGERLARRIQDVYRVNGVDAAVEVDQQGIAIVKTTVADTEKLAQVQAVVLKDVANLDEIISDNTMPDISQDIPDSSVANDPGKRIAMIIPGESPYIVTVDKSRYYVGALLPTGHKITEITENNVMLEKNEATTSLNF